MPDRPKHPPPPPASPDVSAAPVESLIVAVRGQKVILSSELARIYGVEPRALNQAVRRNSDRFPADFVFRLTLEEARRLALLRSQSVILDVGAGKPAARSKSQSVILNRGAHLKYAPLAFTEHGAVMAATVLNSPRAVQMSIFVVRAFAGRGSGPGARQSGRSATNDWSSRALWPAGRCERTGGRFTGMLTGNWRAKARSDACPHRADVTERVTGAGNAPNWTGSLPSARADRPDDETSVLNWTGSPPAAIQMARVCRGRSGYRRVTSTPARCLGHRIHLRRTSRTPAEVRTSGAPDCAVVCSEPQRIGDDPLAPEAHLVLGGSEE